MVNDTSVTSGGTDAHIPIDSRQHRLAGDPNADSIFFRKKFALTLPKEQPGPISPFSSNFLVSDQALEIDCNDIFSHTGTSGFLKGLPLSSHRPPWT
jgi:hypothetical protein